MFDKTKAKIKSKVEDPIRNNAVIAIAAFVVAVIALILGVRKLW